MPPKNRLETGPTVVSEDGFKGYLEDGYYARISCVESPQKKHNTFTGIWTVSVISPDDAIEKILVTSRSNFKVREFKTINGLAAFLDQFGLQRLQIPWFEGISVNINVREDAKLGTSDKTS